jgi:7,8-didemethyl-8-hydroxy-5-deazariboflavin synthase
MAGYALGNRDNEEQDIDILGEGLGNTLNFSKSVNICLFDFFANKEKFVVPYSTIRKVKNARLKGAREVIYTASGRPDRYPHIKSLLELWGFSSYIEYLYTVAELGFLEGLIPVLDVGFITPDEMRSISEISALLKIPLESIQDYKLIGHKMVKSAQQILYRKKNLEWAGKLKLPTITGILIGSGISPTKRKAQLDYITKIHEKYGTIHEVTLDTYNLVKPIKGAKGFVPTKEDIIAVVKQAKSILPEDIILSINIENNSKYIVDYIKAGINDLGTIGVDYEKKNSDELTFDQLDELISNSGRVLHQRFPLSKRFVKEEKYSKKLGQVFDAYRYKIKKEQQEKVKEAKA